MVKKLFYKGKKVYVCKRCLFKYKEKRWAKACEDWEREHNSCNVEVIKHAIE